MLKSLRSMPRPVIYIGLAYFFFNMSSISFNYIFIPYMRNVLGLDIASIGWLSGLMDGSGWILRIFSGFISDSLHVRKNLLLFSFSLAVSTRFIAPFGGYAFSFFLSRFFDRSANALQAPPRDALISEICPKKRKGEAYGIRHSLAVIGSTLGVVFASFFLKDLIVGDNSNFALAFYLTSIPIIFAILIIIFGVKDSTKNVTLAHQKPRFSITNAMNLPPKFWIIVLITSTYNLSLISMDVLNAYVCSQGVEHGITMTIQNLVTTCAAYPFALLSDKIGRNIPLAMVFFISIITNLVLLTSVCNSVNLIYLGAGLMGITFGAGHSIILAKIAEVTESDLKATGFGIYYFCAGLCFVFGNIIFGKIASLWGFKSSFGYSCLVSSIALLLLIKLLGLSRLKTSNSS